MRIHSDTATYAKHIWSYMYWTRTFRGDWFFKCFYVQIVSGQNMKNTYSTRKCQDVDLALHINAQLGNQCFDTYLDRPKSIVICCGTQTSNFNTVLSILFARAFLGNQKVSWWNSMKKHVHHNKAKPSSTLKNKHFNASTSSCVTISMFHQRMFEV